jgi:hypothetical protein
VTVTDIRIKGPRDELGRGREIAETPENSVMGNGCVAHDTSTTSGIHQENYIGFWFL